MCIMSGASFRSRNKQKKVYLQPPTTRSLTLSTYNHEMILDVAALVQNLTTPDFKALVAEYPTELSAFWDDQRQRFDFGHSPASGAGAGAGEQGAVTADMALTTVLLRKYLDLRVSLDPRFLCPRLGNRLAYVLWIQQLVRARRRQRCVWGLDVGTGSSAVYALLACRLSPAWRVVGTEVDKTAYGLACGQVEANRRVLSDDSAGEQGTIGRARVEVVLKKDSDPFFSKKRVYSGSSGAETDDTRDGTGHGQYEQVVDAEDLSFTMCNPPFYASLAQISDLQALKVTPSPGSLLLAREHELVTEGGEVAFVGRMIRESVQLNRARIASKEGGEGGLATWFTSMLGRKSSLVELVQVLKDNGITNYALQELTTTSNANSNCEFGSAPGPVPGAVSGLSPPPSLSSTRRWLLGWNFGYSRPPHDASRLEGASLRKLNPAATELSVRLNVANCHDPAFANHLAASSAQPDDDPTKCLSPTLTNIHNKLGVILGSICKDAEGASVSQRQVISQGEDGTAAHRKATMQDSIAGESSVGSKWVLKVPGNVWSRAYRRRRRQQQQRDLDTSEPNSKRRKTDSAAAIVKDDKGLGPTLVTSQFDISVVSASSASTTFRLKAAWVYGDDSTMLESLVSMLKRQIEAPSTT